MIFFFNDTATTEIYTLSLHDALPICNVVVTQGKNILRGDRLVVDMTSGVSRVESGNAGDGRVRALIQPGSVPKPDAQAKSERSEEHTSELQSRQYLVCRLLLEKKK